MFEIQPSPEFSAWFEALSPAVAEEVACALDLLAATGAALGPSQVRRALLWFDGTGADLPARLGLAQIASAEAMAAGHDLQELLLWQREALRCLESPEFRQRLAQLEPKAASRALVAVEVLRERLRQARLRIDLCLASPPRPLASWAASVSHEKTGLGRRSALPEPAEPSLSQQLREGFFEALRLVGLEPMQILNSVSGLCELTIVTTEPRQRLLFGLDVSKQRVVVLLGEPLTRAYYGDSVKLAERRWQAYCERAKAHPARTRP
jgi:hypothetical protein